MYIKDLLNLVLKIIGIFFIKELVTVLAQFFSAIYYLANKDAFGEGIWNLIMTVVVFSVYAYFAYLFINKTDVVIKELNLTQGFSEEKISVNIHRSTVLGIAVIIIGGLLLVNEIPAFCRSVFSYFQEKRVGYGAGNPTSTYMVLAGAKIVIALFLLAGQRPLVNLIERQRRK
jgi:hypothetical protein